MFYKITRFINKVKKIAAYIPVLWRDEDWDFEFILELLKFKLERTKKCILKNNLLVEDELNKIAEEIDETLAHIYCYQNAYEIYDKFRIKIGHVTVPLGNGCCKMVTTNEDTGKPLTDEESDEYVKFLMDRVNFEQDEWNKVWDSIKKNGQRWWD